MELFEEQQEAYFRIMNFIFNSNAKKFVLNGVAGSGKSTLLKCFLDDITNHLQNRTIVNYKVMTLTGKASQVLYSKGIPSQTIHSSLYEPEYTINEKTQKMGLTGWRLRKYALVESLVIIDESQFLNKKIYNDIMKFSQKVIFIGDPEQLKSIGKETFCINDDFDFFLNENRRIVDNAGNITKLASHARKYGTIPKKFFNNKDLTLMKNDEMTKNFFENNDFDVILCGTNKTRENINRLVRRSKKYNTYLPQKGEIIMNLQNDVLGDGRIFNGEQYVISQIEEVVGGYIYTLYEKDFKQKTVHVFINDAIWEEWQDQSFKFDFKKKNKSPGQWTYGYAMTTFKAMGSEFNNVLFVDENVSRFADRKSFRYTAITRAKENLTIAK